MKKNPKIAPNQQNQNNNFPAKLGDFFKQEKEEFGQEIATQLGNQEKATDKVTAQPPSPVPQDQIQSANEEDLNQEKIAWIRKNIADIDRQQHQAKIAIDEERKQLANERNPLVNQKEDADKQQEVVPAKGKRKRGMPAFLGGRSEKKDRR